jgi:pimeloyl-ACP methyl ester carboxylesterase
MTTLLLLPGLLCDASVWRDQARALGGTTHVRIADFSRHDSLCAMADAALAMAKGRLAVAGHSMGARVAMEMWRRAPERIERLALLDTGTHPPQPGEREKRMDLVRLAREQGMAALAERWLPPMVRAGAETDETLMGPLREMVMRADPALFARQVTALLGRPDAAPLLPTIAVPTIVGVGRDDRWSPPAQHEAMARAIPGAACVVFERSGHMSTVENPAAVTAALADWLAAERTDADRMAEA